MLTSDGIPHGFPFAGTFEQKVAFLLQAINDSRLRYLKIQIGLQGLRGVELPLDIDQNPISHSTSQEQS